MIKTTKQKGEFGMKRTVYEAPVTELFRVELEGTFMSASIYEDGKHQSGVSSSAQEYELFEGATGFETNTDGSIKWE
jgi:hypothetical protein